MEFPCLLSRIFKPKVEKYFTLRDREKNQSLQVAERTSKPKAMVDREKIYQKLVRVGHFIFESRFRLCY